MFRLASMNAGCPVYTCENNTVLSMDRSDALQKHGVKSKKATSNYEHSTLCLSSLRIPPFPSSLIKLPQFVNST